VNDITFHPVHGTFSTCGAPHSPTLRRVFTHVYMNRLRRHYSFLGQGRAHAAKEYVLMYIWGPALTLALRSIRTCARPDLRYDVQPQRHDLCIRYFLRLVKGSQRNDPGSSKQTLVACMQGRGGEEATKEVDDTVVLPSSLSYLQVCTFIYLVVFIVR
jgi:hypothetical protein